MELRAAIRQEVLSVPKGTPAEEDTRHTVLDWIDSGAELCRLTKPATPPRHLVSYFAVLDGADMLLVDHVNAGLWLPSGGHVESGEHPRETVIRETQEELGMEADFLVPHPVYLSHTKTVGKTAGHWDVSLWYLLRGDKTRKLNYDRTEFHAVRWFSLNALPYDRSDPQLRRFAEVISVMNNIGRPS